MPSPPIDPRRSRPRLLTVVVPVYNERRCLPELVERLSEALDGVADRWELLVVDDGSADGSFDLVRELAGAEPRIRGLRLSRNRGHQVALTCGLDHADGDVVVTMDADLQHPPSLLPGMVERWRDGFDIVSMTKTDTRSRSLAKTLLATAFYAVFNAISEVTVSSGASDFRLLDRRCVVALRAMPERRRFLRGLVRWIGFEHVEIPYAAPPRFAGDAQYTVRKLAGLAAAGVLSFSTAPLRLGLALGLLALLAAASLAAAVVVDPALATRPIGLAVLVPVLVLAGLVLLCVGLVGAYVAVVLDEVRARPLYFVADAIGLPSRSARE